MLEIFEVAINLLDKASKEYGSSEQGRTLMSEALQLCKSCLSYDFLATCTDDSIDDIKSVQLPSTWQRLVATPEALQMFFQMYMTLDPPLTCTYPFVFVYLFVCLYACVLTMFI